MSQELAQILYLAQPTNASSGVLAIGYGVARKVRVVVVLKLEGESGLAFESAEVEGVLTVTASVQENIALAEGAKSVFKAAHFRLNGPAPQIAGSVADPQSGRGTASFGADYWPYSFLGCEYRQTAKVQTRDFVHAVERAIKVDLDDAESKEAAYDALNTELRSNRQNLDPEKWIVENIAEGQQDLVRQRFRDCGVGQSEFVKDREVVEKRPKRTRYIYDGREVVTVPADPESVEVSHDNDGQQFVLTIRGKLKSID